MGTTKIKIKISKIKMTMKNAKSCLRRYLWILDCHFYRKRPENPGGSAAGMNGRNRKDRLSEN